MACNVGLLADDCISDHYLPPLKGWAEAGSGRARCPVCGTARALSIQAKSGQVVWNSHCNPPCDRDVIGEAISDLVACYKHPAKRTRKPALDLDQLQALLLNKSVPPNALRIGCLLALGKNMREILADLGLPRSTYYDAVRILGQTRRSASVRILGQDAHANSPNSRTNPQVNQPHKAA